jgi:hypothetical protein
MIYHLYICYNRIYNATDIARVLKHPEIWGRAKDSYVSDTVAHDVPNPRSKSTAKTIAKHLDILCTTQLSQTLRHFPRIIITVGRAEVFAIVFICGRLCGGY